MLKQQIGVVGMSIMGRSLALNIESKGYSVSIFNRSKEKTDEVIKNNLGKKLIPFYDVKEFINSLESPKRILLMIKSGKATNNIISLLIPYLDKGDVLIDGGNSYFQDTIRNSQQLEAKGIFFIGAGFSGGEEGALNGPAIMPGGSKEGYDLIAPILHQISAKVNSEPCVNYIGPDGAGHYLKMIHNGIEYGDMQLIAEVYAILKNILKLNNEELSNIFTEWNKGELNSYLIKITADIFLKKETKTGHYLIDKILDEADHKETGKWTSKNALDLEISLTLITESVFARYISCLKKQRIIASKILSGPVINLFKGNKYEFIEKIRRALYLGKIISYAQGFQQLRIASDSYQWNLNYSKIAKIFCGGCIIRAQFLRNISEAYSNNPFLDNLILAPYFKDIADKYHLSLRDICCVGIQNGIPLAAFNSAIAYYDSYRSFNLPANLIQAQRDYFGAHTYKRIDKSGYFHTKWI
ncbi:6-phosphogluconate dehydrogenase, decarboxylating [Candidatus Arsenophonus lipoptenae]|uniref:6-phosphogluconate dehydrogenase, decarboxylating n=1 Tax=Candidatus Arsenophonus lipoptenae TaxID=634113 RepID=A0A0X9WAH4_9GAMM|nr:NADP-dependent phosphogluconate dehydrogenase [Candidatus Arsenophonus lipoptenae]AMA64883.1 6-phosphogluconate dehydrogenase, decarboxylating [Candidatus Arsenophonus lipoptenae]